MFVRMLTTAAIVGVLLIPIRAKTVGFWLSTLFVDWREQLPIALMTACYDIAFVAGTLLAFAALLLPAARRWIAPLTVYRTHLAFSVITLVDGLSNIAVVPWLGQPFNFQWLYYSDFLRSPDAISSILATVPLWTMGLILASTALLIAIVLGLGAWVSSLLRPARLRWTVVASIAVATATYLGVSFRWRYQTGWSQDILVNPVWAFAESCLRAIRTPSLLLVETPYRAGDFVPPPATPTATLLPASRPVPKHVFLFVMESVGARYLGLYGAPWGVSPVLDSQRGRAAVFTRAYAHVPATNLTLVALMSGRYPRISFRPVTASHPEVRIPHFPRQLRERGYATAFFSSASLKFQRAEEFLAAGGGFERIEDQDARPEAAIRAMERWSEYVGTDDQSTVESMIAWAEEQGERPLMAVLWTAQSHFPYLTSAEPRPISETSVKFNRYLNAVAEGDRALGRLMDWLDATGRADDTLVVVLGDHGQAFGQHKTSGHAGHTWEEHLHIPLVFINRRLFAGETYDTLAGVSDVVPTIAELLNVPEPPGCHGRSLFRADRPDSLFFFAAWSDFLVGYREGDLKVIYNMTRDHFRVYNLAHDPHETRDLAHGRSDLTVEARLRMAGWMQWVEGTYQEAMAPVESP